jgi:O-antigen/teichoic acid export membrane protein
VTEKAHTSGSPRKRSIVANTAMNGIAQFASLVSTLVFFPLLVHAFGVGDYGVYVIALSVTGTVGMFDLGIGASTVRLVARHASLSDDEGFARTVSSAAGLLFVVGIIIALAIAGIGAVAGSIFKIDASQASLLRSLLLIGAASQVWYWPATVASHVLGGLERYDIIARTSIFTTLANVAAIAIVLVTGAGPVVLMLLGVGTMVVASLMNIVALRDAHTGARLATLPSRPVALEILSGGFPIFVAGIAQFLNREQVDRLVLGVFLGPAAVVIYQAASKLSSLVAQFTGLSTSALLPVASGMVAREDEDALRDLFVRGSRYVSLAVAPIAATVIVLAAPFIRSWMGPGFEGSIIVAQLLVFSQLFVPLYQTGDAVLIGKGRFSAWVPRGIALALLNLGLSLALVRPLGVTGVAIGTLVSGLLELPLYAHLVLRETGVTVRMWLAQAGPMYLMLPVALIVGAVGMLTPLGGSLVGVVAVGAACVLGCWAAAYTLVLTSEERADARARLAAISRGRGERAS